MIRIQAGQVVYQVPGKLEELSEKQFLAVLAYLFEPEPDVETRMKVTICLCPDPLVRSFDKMMADQILDIVKTVTAWMDSPGLDMPLKSFRIGLTWYRLPAYSKLSLIESAKAQELLDSYRSTGNESQLNLFLATLCRPSRMWIRFSPWLRWMLPDWDGDVRIKYNAALVAEESRKFSKLSPSVKWAVVWYFGQMMARLRTQYKSVFNYRSEGESKPASLMDMIFHLSGTELGDTKAVSHSPITLALYVLKCRLP